MSIVGAPYPAYVGSNFASRGVTKQAAAQFGPHNIRVNSYIRVCIQTPMVAAAADEEGGGIMASFPLRRLAGADEVAKLALFLACDGSSYITGMEHVMDGGLKAS